MAGEVATEDFPLHGLLPKRETQIESFLRKYPKYNGDEVLIAIFDSGIDPGAPGLSKTPSGKRKVVDVIDCSGCGDVDTSNCVTINGDKTIDGITGRKLKIPESWTNPSGKFFVGCKRLYSLFPYTPLRRVKKDKKEKTWDPDQKVALAKAYSKQVEVDESQKNGPKTEDERFMSEDTKGTVEWLKKMDEKYDDCGPVYDCVVFHDGDQWKVCIDTSENGHLENCQLLSSFSENGDIGRFSDVDMMNYAVTVMEEGKLLSIITNSSSHGTHVASIAAAYFEEQPELNGIAPGAQIISMQIGDTRISGMETGTALIRAMKYAIERGVDVINLSYGESSKWCNSGRVIDMMNKIVAEHNIIFVSSAGNNGPALTTVGAPGGTSDNVIGVGAYVSPDMMKAEYSLIDKLPGNQYTWSSVGPSCDGALGVCITAPGGAITSVPNWTLSKSQLMNGTSMSSPNACGGIAVLLSALKNENIPYSPRSIRRSLENTALKIEGLSNLVQGYGLLQVEKAYEYMKEISKIPVSQYVSFKIRSVSGKRGIYIREIKDFNCPDKYHVTIKPEFHKDTDNNLKVDFNLKLCLVSDQPWVSCPSHLDLNNGDRTVGLEIKKDGLKEGVHYAEVCGYDLQNPGLGPVFRIPITVIIPENHVKGEGNMAICNTFTDFGNLSFKPGQRIRKFCYVPYGTTWVELVMNTTETKIDYRYLIHAIQLGPDKAFIEHQFEKFVTMEANGDLKRFTFEVKGGSTLEICFARYWNASGDSELISNIAFYGVQPNHEHVYLNGNNQFTRVDVINKLGTEKLLPEASLTHHIIPLVPKENLLKPLGERDLLPDGEQVYSLEMTYNFNLVKASEVVPFAPLFHDLLYENKYECQFWICYSSNKQFMKSGDAFPIRYDYACKLEKGDYVIKMQIRHTDCASLEGLKDMPLNLKIKLPSPISLDVFSSRSKLLNKQPKFTKEVLLRKDEQTPLYVATPTEDKLPKGLKPGHEFVGKISYFKNTCSFPLTMSAPLPKNSSEKNKEKPTKPIEEQYKNAVDEFLGQWLAKTQGTTVEEEILGKFSDSLIAQDAILNALDSATGETKKLDKIIDTASNIRKQIDLNSLISYFGAKLMDDEQLKIKEEKEKEKTILINATYKMGLALADKILESRKSKEDEEGKTDEVDTLVEDLNQCYRDLAKLLPATDSKMLWLTVKHGLVHKHYGRVLKSFSLYFDENGYTKENFNIYIDAVEAAGYQHILNYLKQWLLVRFPASYELF